MGKFMGLKNLDIEDALANVTRQYFAGDLRREQELNFIRRNDIEIGITSYNDFTYEMPHVHNIATEFMYMLSGWTQYKDLDTGEVFEYKKGDFYAIEKDTIYAQKSKRGTKILFIKVPSINDKILVEPNEETKKWLHEKLNTVQKDYFYDDNAPKTNSIKPAASVAIIREHKILLLKRADNQKWTLPGGTLELGENIKDCAVREIEEESGYKIKITGIIGIYADPNIRVGYSDGEVRQEFSIVYRGEIEGGDIKIDEESTDYCWIDLSEAEELDMSESQRLRIKDIINYIDNNPN